MNTTEEQTNEISQFIIFSLDNEEYGIEVTKIQEIIGYKGLTRVPNVPDFIKGVLNRNGIVLPVLDLRKIFNMDEKEHNAHTAMIILEVKGQIMAIIVDNIPDVVSFSSKDIQKAPSFHVKVRTDFIKGIGKKDDKLIILLDMDNVLNQDEFNAIGSAVK